MIDEWTSVTRMMIDSRVEGSSQDGDNDVILLT